MDKDEVKGIINTELKKFTADALDKENAKLIASRGSKTHNELISVIKDSIEAVYKTLWSKSSMWRSDIK